MHRSYAPGFVDQDFKAGVSTLSEDLGLPRSMKTNVWGAAAKMPISHIIVGGSIPCSNSCFNPLLMRTLGRSDGPSDWVSATHLGDLVGVPGSRLLCTVWSE